MKRNALHAAVLVLRRNELPQNVDRCFRGSIGRERGDGIERVLSRGIDDGRWTGRSASAEESPSHKVGAFNVHLLYAL